jgi:5-methylthioadenosine/S-adenosylhomocysteine deaminase
MKTRFLLLAVAALLGVALALVRSQTGQREVSLVITNGIVVTMDAAGRTIPAGAVAIDGSDIVAVDTSDAITRQFRGTETVDAAGQVVMPGLINTHTHAPMVLYRGVADDVALMEWLTKYLFPAEARTVSPRRGDAQGFPGAVEAVQRANADPSGRDAR